MVLVHRATSLDDFVVGPDHGRQTYEVGARTKESRDEYRLRGSGPESSSPTRPNRRTTMPRWSSCPGDGMRGRPGGPPAVASTWRCWVPT
jgi:hypothetical protein